VAVDDALKPLADALEADGYRLEVAVFGPSAVRLEVRATPQACADCLVPMDVFAGIAGRRLAEATGSTWFVDIVYPEAS
jgi:hypothetical protein